MPNEAAPPVAATGYVAGEVSSPVNLCGRRAKGDALESLQRGAPSFEGMAAFREILGRTRLVLQPYLRNTDEKERMGKQDGARNGISRGTTHFLWLFGRRSSGSYAK